jgi:hypothetical protein
MEVAEQTAIDQADGFASGEMLPPEPPGFTVETGTLPLSFPAHLGIPPIVAAAPQAVTQPPTEGRIVRYVRPDGTFRAAIVAEVPYDQRSPFGLDLAVIEPRVAHLGVAENVPYDPSGQLPHSWHWPARM